MVYYPFVIYIIRLFNYLSYLLFPCENFSNYLSVSFVFTLTAFPIMQEKIHAHFASHLANKCNKTQKPLKLAVFVISKNL